MLRSEEQPGGDDAAEKRWHSGIFVVRERCGALGPLLRADFRVPRNQGVRRAWLCDARWDASGAAAVQEGRLADNSTAARWRRRIAYRVRYPCGTTGQLGIMAANQRE